MEDTKTPSDEEAKEEEQEQEPVSTTPVEPAGGSEPVEPGKKSWVGKLVIALAGIVGATLLGYFVVYYWVYYDMGGIFNTNVLKGQITGNQERDSKMLQLEALGFTNLEEGDFYDLSGTDTVSYKSSVVEGFQPVKMTEEEIEKGVVDAAYFYDANGNPYYFEVDENGDIIPESLIPLITD